MTNFEKDDELKLKLNRETARIAWSELQRFYAQGNVVEVAAGLDLVDVASAVASDDGDRIRSLLAAAQLGKPNDQRAAGWMQNNTVMWAVVVAPWVLVQDCDSGRE